MRKILIMVCIAVSFAGIVSAQSGDNAIQVISYAGEVSVLPAGSTTIVACKPGMFLAQGAKITTGEESYVEIAFDRAKTNVVKVKEKSTVIIKLEGEDKIELIDGELFALLKGMKKGDTFRVRTPAAVCGARGTGWKLSVTGDVAIVSVFDGKVFVRGVNEDGTVMEQEFWVSEGFERAIEKYREPGKEIKIPVKEFRELLKEFGMGDGEDMEKKEKIFEKTDEIKENIKEEILDKLQEKKDDRLLDKERRDRSDDNNDGGHSLVTNN